MILTGILVLIGGCLALWCGSFFTYGFGQLIENTEAIQYERHALKKASEVNSAAPAKAAGGHASYYNKGNAVPMVHAPAKEESAGGKWRCGKCGELNARDDISCGSCGTYK